MNIYCPRRASNVWWRHPYGQCIDIASYTYVPVPKSASTWCKDIWLVGKQNNFISDVNPDRHYVVVLRDPIERWISGFAQCQVGNDPRVPDHWQRMGWDWVFDTVVFDNHTEPQSSFLAGIDLDRVTWFCMDQDLESNMLHWIKQYLELDRSQIVTDRYEGHRQPAPIFRDGVIGMSQAEIMAQARQMVQSRPGARQRLEQYYQDDLDLYHGVAYYRC